jgi:predicted nuclease with TOPRIM domain
MIGIERVQEYLDLIYKASMLTRSASANLQPPSRRSSRKPSECSMSSSMINREGAAQAALNEMERAKNMEIEKLKGKLKELTEQNQSLKSDILLKDDELKNLETKLVELPTLPIVIDVDSPPTLNQED